MADAKEDIGKACGECKKALDPKKRYYRNGNYFCNKNCFQNKVKKDQEAAAEAAA